MEKKKYSLFHLSQVTVLNIIVSFPCNVFSHGNVHHHIDIITEKLDKNIDIGSLLQRAQLYRDDENISAAWNDYQQVLKLSSDNPDALYLGAKSSLEMGKKDQALSLAKHFLMLVEKHPNKAAQARSYQLLSDIYLAKHNEIKALTYFKNSLHLQSHPSPNRWLDLVDLQLKYEGYNASLSSLKQALSQSGKSVSIQQKIVKIAIKQQDYKTALHFIDQQLETSAALRKVILLVKKSDVLRLTKSNTRAKEVEALAQQAFKQLPDNRKSQRIAKQLQQRLQSKKSEFNTQI